MQKDTSGVPWYATAKAITGFIIVGVVIVGIMAFLGILAGYNNGYVDRNEKVAAAKSNISKEEQRRIDLFNNLADAVKSAKNFEKDTLTKIAEARSQANQGNIEQAQLTLNSVVEAYPEIKSTSLYAQAMLEFSATENRLAQYREQFNTDARTFNNYVQDFYGQFWLSILGKDKTPYKYLDYKTNNAEARDLFKE